jgi:hypothetical protein
VSGADSLKEPPSANDHVVVIVDSSTAKPALRLNLSMPSAERVALIAKRRAKAAASIPRATRPFHSSGTGHQCGGGRSV